MRPHNLLLGRPAEPDMCRQSLVARRESGLVQIRHPWPHPSLQERLIGHLSVRRRRQDSDGFKQVALPRPIRANEYIQLTQFHFQVFDGLEGLHRDFLDHLT